MLERNVKNSLKISAIKFMNLQLLLSPLDILENNFCLVSLMVLINIKIKICLTLLILEILE